MEEWKPEKEIDLKSDTSSKFFYSQEPEWKTETKSDFDCQRELVDNVKMSNPETQDWKTETLQSGTKTKHFYSAEPPRESKVERESGEEIKMSNHEFEEWKPETDHTDEVDLDEDDFIPEMEELKSGTFYFFCLTKQLFLILNR
jgi:hypothetical protein